MTRQRARKKISRRGICIKPRVPSEKAVDLIRNDDLFKRQVSILEPPCQVDRLHEVHIAVVIALVRNEFIRCGRPYDRLTR